MPSSRAAFAFASAAATSSAGTDWWRPPDSVQIHVISSSKSLSLLSSCTRWILILSACLNSGFHYSHSCNLINTVPYRTVLQIPLFQLSLGQSLALADGMSLVTVKDPRGLHTVKLWSCLIDSTNQGSDPEWADGTIARVCLHIG